MQVGLVSDVDLVFDSTHPLSQTITLNSLPGQNITVNLNMGSYPSDNGDLGGLERQRFADDQGWPHGCLRQRLSRSLHRLSRARQPSPAPASTWTNSGSLYVGYDGSGTLNIANGGTVSVNGTTYVAYDTGASGAINFGTNGGTLTTGSLCVSPNQLTRHRNGQCVRPGK